MRLILFFCNFRGLQSAIPENLINAHRMADNVICLPMHHALGDGDIKRVLDCIM